MNIFVVEDSPSIRRLLVRRLESFEGAQVVGEAEGEAQAIALIDWLRPDLVLLDLSLADGGSGLQVLTRLRRQGFAGRIFVLTHQALDPYRDACAEAGADGFYDKGSGIDNLFDDVEALIENRPGTQPNARASNLLRDGLTGLFGEIALLERLDQSARIAQRDNVELAVFVVLLRGLDELAARCGVPASNALLRLAAERLREGCASSDVLARHAPDQFSVVLAHVESADEAARFAEYLGQQMAEVFSAGAHAAVADGMPLTAHVGVALFPGDAIAPRSLLTLSEARAYGAHLPRRASVFAAPH